MVTWSAMFLHQTFLTNQQKVSSLWTNWMFTFLEWRDGWGFSTSFWSPHPWTPYHEQHATTSVVVYLALPRWLSTPPYHGQQCSYTTDCYVPRSWKRNETNLKRRGRKSQKNGEKILFLPLTFLQKKVEFEMVLLCSSPSKSVSHHVAGNWILFDMNSEDQPLLWLLSKVR